MAPDDVIFKTHKKEKQKKITTEKFNQTNNKWDEKKNITKSLDDWDMKYCQQPQTTKTHCENLLKNVNNLCMHLQLLFTME